MFPAKNNPFYFSVEGKMYWGGMSAMNVLPSIEIARKIADILDVSLDFLTGKTDVEIDKDIRKIILKVSKFEEDYRLHIFSIIDTFIAKRKIQSNM